MIGDIFCRVRVLAVDLVALVAALFAPFSLYVVLVIYWGDLIGGLIRRICQLVVAAPREEYSPTGPPAMTPGGDPNPFRFLTPKLGTVQPIDWLPPVAVHNLKQGVVGLFALSLTALAVGLTATFLESPFAIRSRPTIGILTAGGLAIVVKHGWTFRRFVRSNRLSAENVLPSLPWVGTLLMALPVVAVDTVHTGADSDVSLGFSAIAVVLVVGRIAYTTYRGDTSPVEADSFELSAPTGRPLERFRTDRHAVRIAGMIDGLVPRLEWDVLNISSRLAAVFLVVAGWFFGSFVIGLQAATVGAVVALIAVVIGFVFAGIAHFELAFGAMEYRLYDDELVAYDTRLEAVQWRVPLDAIQSVSVDRGFWTGPLGTDAATVRLERTDLTVEQSPY